MGHSATATIDHDDDTLPSTFIVTIPHGICVDDKSWIRKVEVREINGHDEQQLAQTRHYPIPMRSSALIQRVVQLIKSDIQLAAEIDKKKLVQILTQGDRIALILNIRRLIFGDEISCTISCPNCNELISFDLSVSELLQPMISDPKKEYSLQAEGYSLKVRPITGIDLELIILGMNEDDKHGKVQEDDNNSDLNDNADEMNRNLGTVDMAEKLVRSSITFADPPLPPILTRDFINIVSSELEQIDPQANMVIELNCIACQHVFQTNFDAEEFILSEIDSRRTQLLREVHWIAIHYHWEEHTILSLPIRKRKMYLDLINKTISGETV
jgi:hypothetical protein